MFAMVLTRPDIAFVLGKLAQYMSDPSEHHGHALKSLMRYLNSTASQKLRYGPGGAHKHFVMYSDADWASNKSTRKSVSGSVAIFYGSPISWSSKRQRSVATSSCESELDWPIVRSGPRLWVFWGPFWRLDHMVCSHHGSVSTVFFRPD